MGIIVVCTCTSQKAKGNRRIQLIGARGPAPAGQGVRGSEALDRQCSRSRFQGFVVGGWRDVTGG
jgi:hypothetical protein